MKSFSLILFSLILGVSLPVFSQNQTIENNRICMDPIVGSGTFVNATNSGLCVGCPASNGANAVNGDLSDYYQLNAGVAVLLGGSSISIKDTLQYYPGGNSVGFVVSSQGGVLSAAVLANVQIRTYRNGSLVETATFGGGGLLTASVLGGATNGKQMISFTTTAGSDFDEVQLYIASGVTLLSSVRVYYAYEGPAACAADCSVPLTSTGGYSATAGKTGITLICPVPTGEANLVDASLTNSANLSIGLGIACTKYFQVSSAAVLPAGTEAGFVVSNGSGLISLEVLGGIRIQTYNALDIEQDDSDDTPSILGLALLGGTTGSYRVGIKTTKSFTKVRITVGSVASVNVNLDVLYAYKETDSDNDGMPDCMDKCPGGNDLVDADGDGLPGNGVPGACDTDHADVSVIKSTTAPSPVAFNTNVTFTVSLINHSSVNPTLIKVKDLLPAGLTFQSATVPAGTFYNSTTGIWNVGSALQPAGAGLANDTLVLSIVAKATARGVLLNTAGIQSLRETNDNLGTSSSACITVPEQLCEASNMTLHAPAGQTGYQWYRNGTLITGATDSLYSATEAGSYTVDYGSGGGCATGNCCPVVIEMLTRPAASNTPVTACAGSTLTLTSSTGTAGDTYLWNTGETTVSISITASLGGVYNVTKTATNGCFNTDTLTVNVNPGPTLSGAVALCSNNGTVNDSADDTYTFTLNPSGGTTTYSVSGSGFTTLTGLSYGTASTVIGPFAISGGNRTITITDNNGCALTNTTVTSPLSCSSCLPTICVPITITKN